LRLTLESLALMEVGPDRLCLVVNHVGGLGGADVDATADQGLPVTASVPDCPDLELGTVLVAPRDAGHPLTVAVRQVARAVRTSASGDGQSPVSRLLRRRSR
jgi:hypothetical protein